MIGMVTALALLAGAPEPLRLGLVVANQISSDPSIRVLKTADDSAARLYEILAAAGLQVYLLADLDAQTAALFPRARRAARRSSWSELTAVFDKLTEQTARAQGRGRAVELLVIYTGHGSATRLRSPNIYVGRRAVSRNVLLARVEAVGSDAAHVLLDVCRERDFRNTKRSPASMPWNAPENVGYLSEATRARFPTTALLVAESAGVDVHESRPLRSGLFALHLASALAGGADVNGDRTVRFAELHAFLVAATMPVANERERVRLSAYQAPIGDVGAVVKLADGRGVVRLDVSALGGHFFVEDGRQLRWAELELAPGDQASVFLPSGRSYFVETSEQEPSAWAGGVTSQGNVARRREQFAFGMEFYTAFAVAMGYEGTDPADRDAQPDDQVDEGYLALLPIASLGGASGRGGATCGRWEFSVDPRTPCPSGEPILLPPSGVAALKDPNGPHILICPSGPALPLFPRHSALW